MIKLSLSLATCFIVAASLAGDEPRRFRTDADGPTSATKKNEGAHALDWYRLIKGEFPPEGSAHAVSGELIRIDHLERRFQIRVDRNDRQDRSVWDLPLDATMLPYGSIHYRGAPAALQDIPSERISMACSIFGILKISRLYPRHPIIAKHRSMSSASVSASKMT